MFRGRGGDRGGRGRGGFAGRGDRGGRGGARGGPRGGRGAPRGGDRGRGRGGRGGVGKTPGFKGGKGGQKTIVEPHRHAGVFVGRGKEDYLLTKSLTPGESVYGEKRIQVDDAQLTNGLADGETGDASTSNTTTKTEYRVWNPFRSKLAAGILGGLSQIYMGPGSKVLYIGAASGTTVSHVADLVGPTGLVYAVEFSQRSGRDLIGMATKRHNVIPIVEDARHPLKYRMLVGMVDCIFADVAQPDQARIIGYNAQYFLKMGGGILISIKANCIDSTKPPAQVFAQEVQRMREMNMKPKEQLTLEPFERDHAMVAAEYLHVQQGNK